MEAIEHTSILSYIIVQIPQKNEWSYFMFFNKIKRMEFSFSFSVFKQKKKNVKRKNFISIQLEPYHQRFIDFFKWTHSIIIGLKSCELSKTESEFNRKKYIVKVCLVLQLYCLLRWWSNRKKQLTKSSNEQIDWRSKFKSIEILRLIYRRSNNGWP